ncbi:MAG: EpsI family protein [Thiobacillus sp. SCN 62-729]|nr:MAG: EpsI family protein [Thiobacillus sp. SCN 62-729]
MKAIHLRYLFVGLAMFAAASLALALTPRKVVEQELEINLEAMIPKQFGEWIQAEAIVSFNPIIQAKLDRTYNQILMRNYINRKGETIMLSIAYGDEQSKSMRVHLPEVCYSVQGFQIGRMSKDYIDFSGAKLPVMKLVATQGQRIEPITYWIMNGDLAVRGKWEQELARLKYGLSGKVPSGLLIRVSTISGDESQSYRTEEQFVQDMLGAVPMQYRKVLIGPGL